MEVSSGAMAWPMDIEGGAKPERPASPSHQLQLFGLPTPTSLPRIALASHAGPTSPSSTHTATPAAAQARLSLSPELDRDPPGVDDNAIFTLDEDDVLPVAAAGHPPRTETASLDQQLDDAPLSPFSSSTPIRRPFRARYLSPPAPAPQLEEEPEAVPEDSMDLLSPPDEMEPPIRESAEQPVPLSSAAASGKRSFELITRSPSTELDIAAFGAAPSVAVATPVVTPSAQIVDDSDDDEDFGLDALLLRRRSAAGNRHSYAGGQQHSFDNQRALRLHHHPTSLSLQQHQQLHPSSYGGNVLRRRSPAPPPATTGSRVPVLVGGATGRSSTTTSSASGAHAPAVGSTTGQEYGPGGRERAKRLRSAVVGSSSAATSSPSTTTRMSPYGAAFSGFPVARREDPRPDTGLNAPTGVNRPGASSSSAFPAASRPVQPILTATSGTAIASTTATVTGDGLMSSFGAEWERSMNELAARGDRAGRLRGLAARAVAATDDAEAGAAFTPVPQAQLREPEQPWIASLRTTQDTLGGQSSLSSRGAGASSSSGPFAFGRRRSSPSSRRSNSHTISTAMETLLPSSSASASAAATSALSIGASVLRPRSARVRAEPERQRQSDPLLRFWREERARELAGHRAALGELASSSATVQAVEAVGQAAQEEAERDRRVLRRAEEAIAGAEASLRRFTTSATTTAAAAESGPFAAEPFEEDDPDNWRWLRTTSPEPLTTLTTRDSDARPESRSSSTTFGTPSSTVLASGSGLSGLRTRRPRLGRNSTQVTPPEMEWRPESEWLDLPSSSTVSTAGGSSTGEAIARWDAAPGPSATPSATAFTLAPLESWDPLALLDLERAEEQEEDRNRANEFTTRVNERRQLASEIDRLRDPSSWSSSLLSSTSSSSASTSTAPAASTSTSATTALTALWGEVGNPRAHPVDIGASRNSGQRHGSQQTQHRRMRLPTERANARWRAGDDPEASSFALATPFATRSSSTTTGLPGRLEMDTRAAESELREIWRSTSPSPSPPSQRRPEHWMPIEAMMRTSEAADGGAAAGSDDDLLDLELGLGGNGGTSTSQRRSRQFSLEDQRAAFPPRSPPTATSPSSSPPPPSGLTFATRLRPLTLSRPDVVVRANALAEPDSPEPPSTSTNAGSRIQRRGTLPLMLPSGSSGRRMVFPDPRAAAGPDVPIAGPSSATTQPTVPALTPREARVHYTRPSASSLADLGARRAPPSTLSEAVALFGQGGSSATEQRLRRRHTPLDPVTTTTTTVTAGPSGAQGNATARQPVQARSERLASLRREVRLSMPRASQNQATTDEDRTWAAFADPPSRSPDGSGRTLGELLRTISGRGLMRSIGMDDDFGYGFLGGGGWRRDSAALDPGNYLHDDDFDTSYEALLRLSERLGDAKPRGASSSKLATMPRFSYRDWPLTRSPGPEASTSAVPMDLGGARKGFEKEERCAVCLTEYEDDDDCMAGDCGHAFHAECLTEWLGKEGTCPVCRRSHV